MNAPAPVLPSDSTLMRRLVESIESQAFGTTVYVVAEPEFPHDVHGLDTSISEKLLGHLKEHRGARLYGPFTCSRKDALAALDQQVARMAVVDPGDVWVHFDPSEWKRLRGTTAVLGARRLSAQVRQGEHPGASVISAELELPVDRATEIDTIIFGRAAFRKFVVPYLVQVYGLEEAMRRIAE